MPDIIISTLIKEINQPNAVDMINLFSDSQIVISVRTATGVKAVEYFFEAKTDGEGQVGVFKRFINTILRNCSKITEQAKADALIREAWEAIDIKPDVVPDDFTE